MKRYLIEFIGTFFLTLSISLTGNPLAIGLMLVVMVYLGGHISGAHFNAAVSTVNLLQKQLSFMSLIGYFFAQILGAALALCFFEKITNNVFTLELGLESSITGPFLIETLCTMIFCWIYATLVIAGKYRIEQIHAIVLGLALSAIVFLGGIFNPSVAIAALICSTMKNSMMYDMMPLLVYVAGPMIGAVIASFAHNYFNNDALQ